MLQTKFQTMAINLQTESDTKREAMMHFRNSCNICASRGLGGSCDACPIKGHHELTMAAIDALEQYDRIKAERQAAQKEVAVTSDPVVHNLN